MAFAVGILGVLAWWMVPAGLQRFYLLSEDGYVLAGLIGVLFATAAARWPVSIRHLPTIRVTWFNVTVAGAVLALLLWAGTYLLFDNFPLTRDEHMAVFDMTVFRSGKLAMPLPPGWRYYVPALIPEFILPLPGHAAWVSSYLPGNAILRAMFGTVVDPALMNPVLVAIGAVALFDIGRRLFPEEPGAQGIALLMYATSAQVLVTAMTPYAMTAHLAVNLVWLALYLRGTRFSHAGAIALGFVGMGLHQLIFHPLFAAPFIDQLRRRGEWRLTIVYVVCYAAFALFWISYPHLVARAAGFAGMSAATSDSSFAHRVLQLLLHPDPDALPLMIANLARFISWQNLALAPLILLSIPAIKRGDGVARPLERGILFTLIAMGILLPYQGHGWGYRYLHGLIGSCALLAAYGWREFSRREEARRLVVYGSAATIFGSLPFLLWQAHAFARPYAEVDRMVDRQNADIVVIDAGRSWFGSDEVRNRPDLTNRPIRILAQPLQPSDIAALCKRGTIAFIDAAQMHSFGVRLERGSTSGHLAELRRAAGENCRADG